MRRWPALPSALAGPAQAKPPLSPGALTPGRCLPLHVVRLAASSRPQTMTQDVVAVWQQVLGSSGHVPTLLVGHSMGGALAVRAAASQQVSGLEGVVVIDVVEGTALGEWLAGCWCGSVTTLRGRRACRVGRRHSPVSPLHPHPLLPTPQQHAPKRTIAALPHMAAVLAARPPGFPSLEAACDWAVRTGTCKNREMAGVSLPSQLVQQVRNRGGRVEGVWAVSTAGTPRCTNAHTTAAAATLLPWMCAACWPGAAMGMAHQPGGQQPLLAGLVRGPERCLPGAARAQNAAAGRH